MTTFRTWLPAGILALGCLALAGAQRQVSMPLAAPLTVALPDSLPGMKAQGDQVIADAELKISGVSNYILRGYAPDSVTPRLSVYIGYYESQAQGKTIHSPKNCLPGAGWEPVSSGSLTIDSEGYRFPVNRYLLENRGRRALVYYWYQGRGRVSANEYLVKWEQIRDRALAGRSDEALVRIVVPVVEGRSLEEADSLATEVSRTIVRPIFTSLPAFSGRPGASALSGS